MGQVIQFPMERRLLERSAHACLETDGKVLPLRRRRLKSETHPFAGIMALDMPVAAAAEGVSFQFTGWSGFTASFGGSNPTIDPETG